jgi:eukaryotic-like serine/threonine-protein kinase
MDSENSSNPELISLFTARPDATPVAWRARSVTSALASPVYLPHRSPHSAWSAMANEGLSSELQTAVGDTYAIERELGGGGMSRVFLATERSLGRKVVIKVLPPEMVSGLSSARFQREILVTANLQHPHILPVLATGSMHDLHYYVAPFIEGRTLRERLVLDGQLAVGDGLQILRELAGALAHAHARGVIHRDVKPENVFLSEGHAVLADFGIARAIQRMTRTERLTATGQGPGTPGYMAPEQLVDAAAADPRVDVFALGVVAYEMFTGRAPFAGDTPHAVAASYFAEAPALESSCSDLPAPIARAITRALSTNPDDRFANAGEFLTAIRPSLDGVRSIGARRRPRGLVLAVTAFALMAIGAIGAATWLADRSPAEAASEHRKMLVVLPFKNLGAAEDAYFADGVTEEVTSRLASLGGLGVISRTSADKYAASTKTLKEIARELGAEYVLEGSVRWQQTGTARGRVRVIPQLIRVSDDSHLWTGSFDAELKDVFTVQTQIAEKVADELAVAIPGASRRHMDAQPTNNLAAYQSYIRGEQLRSHEGANPVALARAEQLFTEATTLDSRFALAFAKLALVHSLAYETFIDRDEKRLAAAKAAADSAVALDKELPEARLSLGRYFEAVGNFERAAAEFAEAERGRPNDVEILLSNATVLARRGQWKEAVSRFRDAAKLNPRSVQANMAAAVILGVTRDLRGARNHVARAIAADSEVVDAYTMKAKLELLLAGDVKEARETTRELIRRFGPASAATSDGFNVLLPALETSDFQTLERVTLQDLGGRHLIYYFWRVQLYDRWDHDRALIYADSLRVLGDQLLASQQNSARLYAGSAFLATVYGDKVRAVEHARRSLELAPRTHDVMSWADAAMMAAHTFTRVGETDAALELLEQLVVTPSWVNPAHLRTDPDFVPLRDNPRFQRLLRGT